MTGTDSFSENNIQNENQIEITNEDVSNEHAEVNNGLDSGNDASNEQVEAVVDGNENGDHADQGDDASGVVNESSHQTGSREVVNESSYQNGEQDVVNESSHQASSRVEEENENDDAEENYDDDEFETEEQEQEEQVSGRRKTLKMEVVDESSDAEPKRADDEEEVGGGRRKTLKREHVESMQVSSNAAVEGSSDEVSHEIVEQVNQNGDSDEIRQNGESEVNEQGEHGGDGDGENIQQGVGNGEVAAEVVTKNEEEEKVVTKNEEDSDLIDSDSEDNSATKNEKGHSRASVEFAANTPEVLEIPPEVEEIAHETARQSVESARRQSVESARETFGVFDTVFESPAMRESIKSLNTQNGVITVNGSNSDDENGVISKRQSQGFLPVVDFGISARTTNLNFTWRAKLLYARNSRSKVHFYIDFVSFRH